MASAAATAFAEKHNAKIREAQAADVVGEAPKAGHNSAGEAKAVLKGYFDRRLALEQSKQELAEDIRELNTEVKAGGVDPRALAVMVKRELEDEEKKAKRVALQEVVDSYAVALGFLD